MHDPRRLGTLSGDLNLRNRSFGALDAGRFSS